MTPPSRRRSRAVLGLILALAIGAPGRSANDDPHRELRELRDAEKSDAPPSEMEVSRRLTGVARRLLEQGSDAEAIELLSEAVTRDSRNGVALATLTLAYVRRGDLEFAEFYLELARQSAAPGEADPTIYDSLGDAYASRNRLDEALESWEQARRLGMDSPALRRKIAQARSEWAFSHGQRYYSGDRFEIFYDPAISSDSVRVIEDSLEGAALSESEVFQASPPVGQVVILYQGRRYFRYQETPDWVGGYYDGKIRVPLEAGRENADTVFAILRHELAHAFLQRISHGTAPAWLQEGIAQVVEGKWAANEEARTSLARLEDPSLDALEGAFHQRADARRARDAYIVSLSFVQFLARRSGIGAVTCLITDMGSGASAADAFLRSFGETRSALAQEWRRELERR